MAAAALPADGSSQGLEAGLVPEVAAALASSLQLALQAVPSLAGPAALAPVEALLPVLPQVIACCLEGLACDLPAMHVCNECGCWPPVQECLDVRCSLAVHLVRGLQCTLARPPICPCCLALLAEQRLESGCASRGACTGPDRRGPLDSCAGRQRPAGGRRRCCGKPLLLRRSKLCCAGELLSASFDACSALRSLFGRSTCSRNSVCSQAP